MTAGNEEYQTQKERNAGGGGQTRSPNTKNDDESRLDDCKKLQRTSPEVSGGTSNAPIDLAYRRTR